jgi:ABC-2 type transport system permease protein
MVMLAAVGTSLIIAGATLVWKRIQMVNDTVLTLVMLFSATAVPLVDVPDWWTAASHAFPLTDGDGSLFKALLTDQSITAPWGIGGLVPLLAVSIGYLGLGILAFSLGERVAKRRGTLGRY